MVRSTLLLTVSLQTTRPLSNSSSSLPKRAGTRPHSAQRLIPAQPESSGSCFQNSLNLAFLGDRHEHFFKLKFNLEATAVGNQQYLAL